MNLQEQTYTPILGLRETQIAIKLLKDYFERELATALNLTRVSAPLFVLPNSGLNDNLNGSERPVGFDVLETGDQAEIVHSLAKWKRMALKRYGFQVGEGLYTDMNAIRRDEKTDALHSLYVDQWDWEKVIDSTQRTKETLQDIVRQIYLCLKRTEIYIRSIYPHLPQYLPDEITFISTQELEDLYPDLTGKERENEITKKYGAVFLSQIGCELKSGKIHDGRAPDYDDWNLNGDILLWYPLLDCAFELSSMGIRVDEESLKAQCAQRGCEERLSLPFHKALLNRELPYTIGGGIGQSRICMFLLSKLHIGEVQASIWPQEMVDICAEMNIPLL